jgi:hypothetical protein
MIGRKIGLNEECSHFDVKMSVAQYTTPGGLKLIR